MSKRLWYKSDCRLSRRGDLSSKWRRRLPSMRATRPSPISRSHLPPRNVLPARAVCERARVCASLPIRGPAPVHRSRDKSSPRAVRPDHGERQSPLPEIGAARNYTHFSPPVVGMPPCAPARPPACLAPTNAGWLHPGGAAAGAARARVRDASKEAPRGVYTHAKSTAGDRWYGTSMRSGAPTRQVISATCNLAD